MNIISGIIGTGIGEKHFEAIENCKNSRLKFFVKNESLNIEEKVSKKIITDNENKIFKDKNINFIMER